MTFYALSPEVAGQLGEDAGLDTSKHPPVVSRLHYEFDGWLGDDIVESFPCFVVTARLAESTAALHPTGAYFDDVVISKSATFEEIYPDRELPLFRWLRINGECGADDFGISKDQRLVVSGRVLDLWRRHFRLANCDVEEWHAPPT